MTVELRDALLTIQRADETDVRETLADLEAEIALKRAERLKLDHEISRRHALAVLDGFFAHFGAARK